jgi:hypothetical protein
LEVRQHLLIQKKIRTAFESTRTIGFFVEAPTRLQRAQDLVDVCDKHYVADQQPGLLLLVEIKLFQAKTLIEANRSTEAKEPLLWVQKRLERLSLSQYQVDRHLEYPNRQCRALSSLQESGIGLETRINALLQYAEEADLSSDFLSELQYLNDARGLLDDVPRDQWDAYRLQAMENVESRMTSLTTHHELGAFFVCSSLMIMGGNLLNHNIGAADSFLNNLRWFEERYPHFNIPELSWITATCAEIFAGRVGNTKSEQEYRKLKNQALANLPTAEKTIDGTLKMAAKWYSDPTMFDQEYRLLGHHHLWPRYLLKILKL